jgi:outer membrane protein OmpA-like peptidoglycan-associated protein
VALAGSGDLSPVLAERDVRITALTAALAERETTIGGLEDEVARLRSDLTLALAERDERIGILTATLAGRDAVVERLQAEAEALRGGADLGAALAALEAESDSRIAALTTTLAERDATIAALQDDIETLRRGTEIAPTLTAVEAESDKPVLAFGDQASEIARLSALLDAVKLGPEVMTVALANPTPALRMAPALRPAGEDGPMAEVHFEMGSARLSPGGLARAAAAAVTLADMPLERIRVVGYADRTGSASFNRALAERRAEAVSAFLIANGLPAEMIETAGMIDAADLPVATGPGVAEPLNRSVAIIAVPRPTS